MGRTMRVFIVGAYLPSGAAQMNYVIGEIIAERLGLDVCVVTTKGESYSDSPFDRKSFPTIAEGELESAVQSRDIVLTSPSWSSGRWWGLRLNCRKIMYVQAVDAVPILDGFFDVYVSVSEYCRAHIAERYGIQSSIINPFVELPRSSGLPWNSRPKSVVLVNSKRDTKLCRLMLAQIEAYVKPKVPGLCFKEINGEGRNHKEFLSEIEQARYLLTLSPSEGFGLVPLEAMSRSVAVTGFHGMGGLDFMRHGFNCECWPYPNIAAVGESLLRVLENDEMACRIGAEGVRTAERFSKEEFSKKWVAIFEGLVD